jgi:tRNA modification GTPase
MPTTHFPTGDTIAAQATPPGRGGLGVIRVSGPASLAVASGLFVSARPGFAGLTPYRLHHGHLRAPAGRVLDEVMAAYLPGPGSYTGEDTVEFFCHGSPVVLGAVLAACFALGARPALPGEFTRRAFVNGRLDLSQAEAVAELIAARADTEADLALARLDGAMGRAARELGQALAELRAGVCLAVDFPEEDTECLSPEAFAAGVSAVLARLDALAAANRRARPFRQGIRAALFGRVNAGKSSLFNALLGRDRALVADRPGTTRDFLEEELDFSGVPVTLADTAGLGATDDDLERAGQDRGVGLARTADLGLYVVDGSRPLTPDPAAEAVIAALTPGRVLAVVAKADLPPAEPDPEACLRERGLATVRMSSRTGQGLETLVTAMRERVLAENGPLDPGLPAPSDREAASLAAAREELAGLLADIRAGLPYDLLGVRLETASQHLAGITGETTPEAVLNAVFARFCLGK